MDCEKCADDQGGADFTCVLQLASHDNGGYAAVIRLKDLQPLPAQLIVRRVTYTFLLGLKATITGP